MKQLYITEVKNGWIVRTSSSNYAQDYTDCYIYTTVEALQQALPSLLQASVKPVIVSYPSGLGSGLGSAEVKL